MERIFRPILWLSLIVAFSAGFFVFINKVEAEGPPFTVGINEIKTFPNGDPDSCSGGDNEYIELWNTTSEDIDLSGWKVHSDHYGDLLVSVYVSSASTTIPANGLLLLEMGCGVYNNTGDILQVIDPSETVVYEISYGDKFSLNPMAPHFSAPGEGESAILLSSGNYEITTNTSKGWFNDAIDYACDITSSSTPPTLSSVDACLFSEEGVNSNLGEFSNYTSVTGLYFEKPDNGQIYFEGTLNLTDQTVVTNIANLGQKMALEDGIIVFDSEMAQAMGETGASLEMYNFDDYGYNGLPEIYVYDDDGLEIEEGEEDYPVDTSTIEYVDGTLTFSVEHFTEFGTGPSVTEITPVAEYINTTTPTYVFGTNVTGTFQILGSCATGGPASTTNGNNTVVLGPLSEALYSDCEVKVIDGVGNSSTLNISSFTVDVTLPTGSITNLSDGSYVRATTTIEASVSDEGVGIEKVEFWYWSDGTKIGEDSTVPYSIDWDTTTALEGSHNLVLKVYDNAGNKYDQTGYGIAVTVDNTEPTVTKLGDGLSDYSLPSTCPSTACNRGDIYGAAITFSEELNSDSKNSVESAITAGASVAPRTYVWMGRIVRIYATEPVTFANDVIVSSISDLVGNTSADVKLIDSKNTYIQDQINAASSGDTIIIPAGTYEENITINKAITLLGDIGSDEVGAGPNAPVIIDSVGNNRTVNILSSGVTFRGFIVENNGSSYPAVRFSTNVGSTTIKNNTLRNAYSGLTLSAGTHDNTIVKNKIYNNYEGIFLNGSVKNTIAYNEIYSNSDNGIEFVGNNNAGSHNINNNHIYSNTWHGIHLGSYLDTTDGAIIIDSNDIELNGRAGVRIEDNTSQIQIVNNTINSNGQNELSTGIHTYTASGNYARGNTIISDNSDIGIVNSDTGNIFDASMNWWGYESGPYHSTNINGEGDQVSNDVNFSPWYGNEGKYSLRGIPAEDGGYKSYTLNEEFNVENHDYTLVIPAGTTVTGTSVWDGDINRPTATETPSNLPTRSGYTTHAGNTIEVGFADGKLVLSNAARLLFPGAQGKRVGYTRAGESFTEITEVCGTDSQSWADTNLSAEGDCKKDVGNDLVVWTKHFTKFSTFTLTQNSTGGGGGGGTPIVVPVLGVTPVVVSGGNIVKTRDITLLFNVNYATMMVISEKSNFSDTVWGAYDANQTFKLSEGYGNKILYVKFRSATGGEISTQVTVNYVTSDTAVSKVETNISDTTILVTDEDVTEMLTLINSVKFGQSGNKIKNLQAGLRSRGYFKYPTNTGYYGLITKQAVIDYLISIKSDGLDSLIAMIKYGETSKGVKSVQNQLKDLGFFNFHVATSYYGRITKQAIDAYLKSK